MIHVWQPSLSDANAFKVWEQATQRWHGVSGWQEVVTFAHTQSMKASHKDVLDVCLYVPTASVLSVQNQLSSHELKQLGITGKQYLFEDVSLTPVEQLQVRSRAQTAPPSLYAVNKQTQSQHLPKDVAANSEEDERDAHQIAAPVTTQTTQLYALNSTRVTAYQNSAKIANINIKAVLPDFLLLPLPDHSTHRHHRSVSAYIHSSDTNDQTSPCSLTLRVSPQFGLSISMPSLLPNALPTIQEIIYIADDTADIPAALQRVCDSMGVVLTPASQPLMPVVHPARHWLNFVQTDRTHLLSPYLQVAAMVLVAAGIMQIVTDAVQWYQYDQAATAVEESNIAQFESWFDGDSLNPNVMLKTQVTPRLARQGAMQQQQIDVLNGVSPLIKRSNLTAQSLSWDDSKIMLTVIADRREDVDNLQRSLSQQRIDSELGAITPTESGVQAQLSLPLSVEGET